ncbi:sensor histidine kinase [Campylobacter hyointestinalis]|uniref:sensor histidine kinase n=1 Tax=Campylobacter hyointestinalis TaxID=198 RepID=UPI000DCCB168|nr:HAMP domain-containing sensor histidine kinase [Campylobacter hyointestinalis]RAZ56780.1 sensor histidine kinase [Campylobacter hyointestinalis subsp. lawsonii]RAZ64811.1 sensor histidine kinase [Campylobacter hyointestinalis subsp. lawsonii]
MLNKKYFLPIFLLYTITSSLFLIFFTLSYYKTEKDDIYKKTAHQIRAYANEIEFMLRANGGYEKILNLQNEYEINLFDIKSNRYIIKQFDKPKFKNKFYNDKHYMYYSDDIHSRKRMVELNLDIRTSSPKKSIDALFLRTSVIFVVVLLAIFIIAYFIVRLSYLPLLNQIKTLNNFITDTTHEINTPLSVILMSAEMFDKNPTKYLENIKIAAKTLSHLYSDLSLNLKNEPNHIETLNLKDILEKRIQMFELSAANKGITIISKFEDVGINTDSSKFKKIFDNLLSNAIKYAFKNSDVVVSLDSSTLSVVNHGNVIEKENLNKIYDKFSRFDTQNGGFGIGLSLVKRYCDDLGFEVYCQSANEKTEFSVKFKK